VAEEEKEEETLVIEDDEETIEDEQDEEEAESQTKEEVKKVNKFLVFWKKHKQLILFGFSLVALVVFFAILFFVFREESEKKPQDTSLAKKLSKKEKFKKILKKSSVKKLLEKANLLYTSNQKEKALAIYHQIALYNESISYYNLGVSQIKEKNFSGAYQSFKKALQNRENQTASAINAAVCALKLGKQNEANYYLKLASATIYEEVNSPIYSYYYELINFYKDRPFKTLAASLSATSKFYKYNDNKISAQIYTKLDDYLGALNSLSKNEDVKDAFTLGLLHAKIGEYTLAIKQFERAIKNNVDKNSTIEALLLAYLKNSNFSKAAALINHMPRNYQWNKYPIEVFLKPRLFNIDLAQQYFKENFFLDKEKIYSAIFYFAPYQIFDPTKTFRMIKKGQTSLSVNDIAMAKKFLQKSTITSGTNANIAIAIKLGLNLHTSKANKIFKKLNENFKAHDTLEYNLALTYAQLSDYVNAYKHFRRAHFLNKKNKLAGIFALFCASLSGKPTMMIEKRLTKEIRKMDESLKKMFYLTLISFYKDNFSMMVRWLEVSKNKDPLYILMEAIIANKLKKDEIAKESAKELLRLYPNDMVVNILYLYLDNKKSNIKRYAFRMQDFMTKRDININALFYGPDIARDLYLLMAQISGNLPKVRIMLKEKLKKESYDTQNIIQALAKTDIYLKKFEEAFVLYNQLIDELKVRDTSTLLYAAIAAIGAGHKENAIVLLEIAKMIDKENFEARYGLGLLYQEVKRYNAAAIEYGLIKDENYQSQYFDFMLTPR